MQAYQNAHDCRHQSFGAAADCGDDLIHFLSHLGHCCKLVGISTGLIEQEILRARATWFGAGTMDRTSAHEPGRFRPPILSIG